MKQDFLLNSVTAKKLYIEIADLPIIDYHCHLSIHEIIDNKPLENIAKTWLDADHYKWRLMRTGGVEERCVTGNAPSYEKFEKYMQTLVYAIGSPLYNWSRLELYKYFDVTDELLPRNIAAIYNKANSAIAQKRLTPQKILELSNVERVCIVEDATALDVAAYEKVHTLGLKTLISPIMRVDRLLSLSIDEIKKITPSLIAKFTQVGCSAADFGVEYIDEHDERSIEKYSYVLKECYKNNFAVQLHFGAMRNNNKLMFDILGADKGYDSISEKPYLAALAKIFNRVGEVGKTIIFNLNPADNAKIATFAANYVGSGIKGKVQMGAAWWFNDNKDGIMDFFKSLSNMSMLSASVGMLTDSRSITSYVRHEYFRRLLCNYVGELSEKGEFTADFDVLQKIVCDVSYYNIKEFLS